MSQPKQRASEDKMQRRTRESRISDLYYASAIEFERSSKVFTRSLIPVGRSLRILDVGCGTGLNAKYVAGLGHTVVGMDISPVAIEKFKQRGFEGFVFNLEREELDAKVRGSFDLVFASEVIEHIVDTDFFLANIHRALSKGGLLILSTPNSAFWVYRILALVGKTASENQHPGHVRFFSKRSLKAAIESAEFEIQRMAARHMYLVVSSGFGDWAAPVLKILGFQSEPRFATGGHFWQLSAFAPRASGWWADTLIVVARKRDSVTDG